MKKIISLFCRNHDGDKLVRNEVSPGAEWVIAGEGVATHKYDGTCCLVRGGKLYKRYEAKQVGARPFPIEFEPCGEIDPVTGRQQGWVPVGNGPEDRWHREAFALELKWNGSHFEKRDSWANGTYELIGPKVQGNPERYAWHQLVPHSYAIFIAFPRTYDEIKAAFSDRLWGAEGVVWHHPDGRMVKIKVKDFGLVRSL